MNIIQNETVKVKDFSHNNRCIEVLSIEPSEAPGLLATVAVRCGGILFRDVRVTNRGRGTFVNFPSRKVGGVWVELVEFTSPALRNAVVECVLNAMRGAQ